MTLDAHQPRQENHQETKEDKDQVRGSPGRQPLPDQPQGQAERNDRRNDHHDRAFEHIKTEIIKSKTATSSTPKAMV